MSIPAETVRFEGEAIWVSLSDGRVIGVPLAWFPRRAKADAAVREAFEIGPLGLHWEVLDEDVSVARLERDEFRRSISCLDEVVGALGFRYIL